MKRQSKPAKPEQQAHDDAASEGMIDRRGDEPPAAPIVRRPSRADSKRSRVDVDGSEPPAQATPGPRTP